MGRCSPVVCLQGGGGNADGYVVAMKWWEGMESILAGPACPIAYLNTAFRVQKRIQNVSLHMISYDNIN